MTLTKKPQAYRNTETGTIAWINQPYKDWVSIAPVLDTIAPQDWDEVAITCLELKSDLLIWRDYLYFPVAITELPDGWEVCDV